MKKTITAFICIIMAVLSLVGCSCKPTSQQGNNEKPISSANPSADLEEHLNENIPSNANGIKMNKKRVYYCIENQDKRSVEYTDIRTGERKAVNIEKRENTVLVDYDVTDDNTMWVLIAPLSDKKQSYIYAYNSDGEKIEEFSVNGLPTDMAIWENQSIILCYENAERDLPNEIVELSLTGDVLHSTETKDYPRLIKTTNGDVFVQTYGKDDAQTIEMVESGALAECFTPEIIKILDNSKLFDGTDDYQLFSLSEKGFIGLKNNEYKILITPETMNTISGEVNSILPVGNNQYCVISYTYSVDGDKQFVQILNADV